MYGEHGCGKTTMAAHIANEGAFDFVRMISPENFLGYSDLSKIDLLNKTFEDASKSKWSCLIIDDIERVIGYTRKGPCFSNSIVQALLILCKKLNPKPENKLLIIGTTSLYADLAELDLDKAFSFVFEVPLVKTANGYNSVIQKYDQN